MKKVLVIFLFTGITIAAAQFKPKTTEQPRVADSFIQPQSASDWFNFFNPNSFQMRHSYSASYTASGGQGIALQRYTNTLLYEFFPNLDARVDFSLQNSPYSTLDYRLQDQFSRASLSRVELNYRPTDNMVIRLQYRELPYDYFGYGYRRPFGGMFSGLDQYED